MNTSTPLTGRDDLFAPPPSSVWERIGRAWNRFFFNPADPTTLGLIRICCGLIALYTAIAFGLDLQEFFGTHGWMDLQTRNTWRREAPTLQENFSWEQFKPTVWPTPEALEKARNYYQKWGIDLGWTWAQGEPIWSLWFHVTDPSAMLAVHYAVVLVVFLFMIGFCTRVTSVLAWFGMLGYINRSPTTVFGVDTMMSIAMFYLMIGPSGAALSVDRLIRRWWVSYRFLRKQRGPLTGPVQPPAVPVTPSVSANLTYRLFQIHLCIIYGAAGLAKLQGASWWTGEAVWGTLANFDFAPMQYGFYYDFLKVLCDHRLLWQIFMAAGTIFTLVFEIGFPFLVWNPRTRWVFVGMAVVLHGGIGLFMGLKTFSLMMLTLVMAFTPPDLWKRLLAALSQGPRGLRLYFPVRERKAVRAASVVHALDVYGQVALEPAAAGAEEGLVLVTPNGEKLRGWGLRFRLLRSLGIFRFFSPLNWLSFRQAVAAGQRPRPEPEAEPEPVLPRPVRDAVKVAGSSVKPKR